MEIFLNYLKDNEARQRNAEYQENQRRENRERVAELEEQHQRRNAARQGIEEFQAAQANGQLPPPRPGTRTAAELNYTGANPATAINPTVHVGMVSRNAEVRNSSPEASEPQTAQRYAEEQGLELVDWDYNEVNRDVLYRTDTAPTNPFADTIVATPDNMSQGETPEYRWQDNLNYVDPLTEWELSLTPQERRAYQNERLAEQRQEEMTEFAEEHPYIGTAAQLAMIPGDLVMTSVGGLYEANKKGTIDYFNNLLLKPVGMMTDATNKAFVNMGNETGVDAVRHIGQTVNAVQQEVENYNGIDPNNPLFVLGDIRQGLQQGTMNVVDVNVGGTDVFDFAYGAATSAAESIAAAAIPGGAVFLSTKAGTEAMRSAKEKGLSDNDAVMMGVFTGVIEAITERIPLENIRAFSTADTLTVKGIIKNVLKQSATEGTEELISETANIIYDTLVHGDLSDYNLAVEMYQNQGYSLEEAKKKAREDLVARVVEAFAQGALAGGMTGAGASTVGYVSNRGTQKQYGADLREKGDINEYVQTGLNAPKNTEAYQIARNITDKSGDAELGALVLAVEDYEAQVASQNNNRFSEYNTVEALDEAYEIAKVKINPKAKGTIKNLDRDYKAAKNRIKTAERTGRSAVQSTTVRNAQQTRGTAENAQPTQSTQSAEAKPLTPEQKVQTTNPTVGRTAEGKVVSVSDITDIKNGQIFVKTSDGKTQALKYADIGNAQARKVWEMAAKSFTDPKAAKAFIDNYNGETISDYANAFNDYYQLASAGMSLEQINEAGVAKGNISLAAKVAAVDAGAMSISYRKGVVDQTTTKKTKMQSLQMQMLDSFGKKYGLNITFVNTLGDFNGFYKPGTNHIVVGLDASEGAVTRTVGHEVYHYIKDANKEGAQKIEDFVLKSLKKLKGEEWVQNKLDSYDKSTYKTEQERIDELVADSMFDVFTNEKTVQEFVKQDRSLAQRVLDRVKTLIADIRNIYNKLIARGSDEISALRNELETLEKIRDLFFEALDNIDQAIISDAVSTKPISNDEIITDGAVAIDNNGIRYSIKSMRHDISEGKMFEDLKTYCGFSDAQANELKSQIEGLVDYMVPYREIVDLNETFDREGRPYSPYKPNSDPLYTISLDYSTLCSKRLLTQYVIEQLQLRENRPMSAEEQMAIRDMLKEYGKIEKGLQVACVMCYVEAARLKAPKQINRWLNNPEPHLINYFAQKNKEYRALVEKAKADFKVARGYNEKTAKKDMSSTDRKELNKLSSNLRAKYKPSSEERSIIETALKLPNSIYLTAGNLADLSETHPVIYDAYTSFIRMATRSKALETEVPYYYGDSTRDNGNGLIVSDSFIKSVNKENGLRFSSWSDWRIQHLLDWITAVIENSVRGTAMHGYTKYPDEVRVLGNTGMMFNLSGVAGTQTGFNEDGSLSFSDTESINVKEAIALREEFPEFAGLQCIGVSSEHVLALLRSDIIDYVIPYHISGLNATLRKMGDIYGWIDFTSTQHASNDSTVKKNESVDVDNWHKEPVFSEFFVGYDTKLNGTEAMQKSAENYKRMCRERGLTPKFSEFSNEPNYWKLLIERKMVNQKTNTLIKQKPVSPKFDFKVIKDIVDKYVANYDEGLEQRALKYIVENWDSVPKRIRELKRQGSSNKKSTKKSFDTLANETVASQPKANVEEHTIKKSTKPTNPIREEVSDYIISGADVQSVIKTIDKRYRLAGKKKLNEKSIQSFANKILSQTNSKYSKEQLTERLTALFEFMANSRDFSWDDIMQITAEISKDVLSQSSRLDTSMRDEFSDTLKWLKGIDKVYISPEVRAEIDATFGSLDSFRRQIGSRMKITVTDSSAISLDSVWSQLAGDYPGVFDSEITPLDQPAALADFFEMTKPTYQNPYEMDMDEAAYDYALRIYDQYFDIPEVKTEAQKHQIAMQRAREDFNKRLDTMRKEYKAREQEIVREAKLQTDNRIAREQLLNKRRQEAYREKRFETELVQKYRAQILRKLNGITKKLVRPTDSEHIPQELIKSINDFAKTLVGSGAFTSQKADNLKKAFDAIGEAAQNPNFNLASMYDEDIAVKLDNLKSILDGRRFSDLSSAELKKVREITDYFAHIIKMSNEAFSESIKESISDLQSDAMDSARDVGSNRKRMGTAFQTGLLKPVTFFELLDNPTLEKLYTVIRNGEGDWYRVVNKSKEFLQKIKKEYNFKNWKKDTVEIELERGKKLTLTVGEAMSIYATAKRKNAKYQGADHLMKGGAVLEKDALKKLKKVKKKDVDIRSENIPLTFKDIQQISSALTEEQKGFANKMVEYLSTDMAELGNERTMRIYGIRKFNESNYFPIRSAINFRYTKPGVQDDARIKHMSMTKNTTPHANNPVIIGDFTEVAMNHCNDMALYYGFVLALEDFTRVYNYKTMDSDGTNQKSVKQYLEKSFGEKANSYIMQMLTDINGGVKAQAGTNVINKMMSKAKKDAVFASLSVAVQQPSAIARTMLYLNPKYLAKTTFSKRSWNELKEYAPVAGVKDMGYFDANIGRQAVDWMLDEKYEGLKEKAFALFKDGNYRDDLLSFLPAYMDRITWGHIWEAVKAETKDKTDYEVGSKEFLEAAGERFTYIIDRTQVYDSVFSRSEWMRSKDTGMKTVMAFMAEPVTNLNMLFNAAVKARHGDVGFLAKALSAYAISVALNSALKALVTAGRDDDEEKSYLEKYLSSFISGIIEEPFGMIPYLKDAISLWKGYDSKRMDTQVIANFVDSIKTIFNGDKSDYEKLKAVASAVGTAIGVPVKNIWRDTEMIYNGVMDIVKGTTEATTDKGIEYAVKGALGIETPNTARQYVDAYFEGDQGHLEKTYGNLSEKYEGDEDKINTQIKTALGEGYRDGAYTEEQVIEFLEDYFGMDEDEAYWQAQKWKNNENDDWTKYSDFIEALESGENIDAVIEEYYSHGADKRDLSSAMTSYFKEKYLSVYESDPEAVRDIEETMLAVYEKLGYEYDSNDIFWKFQEWEGGNDYSKYADFYEAIESGTELRSTINFYVEHGVSKQTLATNITKNYKEQYIELYHTDRAAADRLRRQLIEAYAALGYNRQDKAKDIAKWLE